MRRVLALLLLCASLAVAGDHTMPGERVHARPLDMPGLYWNPITQQLGHGTKNPAGSVEWIEEGKSAFWRLVQYSGSGTTNASFEGRVARGTRLSPAAVQSGDVLLQFNACGHDGVGFCGLLNILPDANISLLADGTWTTSSHPSRIEEYITLSGSTTRTLARTTASDGGQKFLGKILQYNNIGTVSNGVPSELGQINTTGLTANVASATLYAVPAASGGLYRISALVVETTAASVSSTLPNVQIIYTDVDTNGSVTIDATPVLGVAGVGQTGALTANTVGTTATGVIVVDAKASTNISYQTVNYASSIAGMTYAIHLRAEAL